MDHRLLWLRFLKKMWIVPLAVLAGAIVVGAVYYYSRTAARGGRTYQAESIFYVDFAEDARGEAYDYYNYYTWSEVIHTDHFMDYVREKVDGELSRETLESYVTATVVSDVRYLYVRCNTHSPELSVRLASAMEEAVLKYADLRKELRSIELVKAGDSAKDSSKVRLGNAFFLGGCLGFVTSVLGILIALTVDTAVYLPSTVEKRYHVACLGAPFLPEYAPNWEYFLKNAARVAVVFADEEPPEEDFGVRGDTEREIVTCRNPVEHPGELDRIRGCEAVILVLKAGCRNDKVFERLLEQLGRQEIKVTAAALACADKKLLSAYYRSKP